MIQLCGKSIVKPLKYLFGSSIKAGIFPENWKKGNVFPVHKKESKNCLKNYRPISLLPIFSKIFERIMLCLTFLFKISCLQIDFIPGDSCVSQLLSIAREIHRSFDCNPPEEVS